MVGWVCTKTQMGMHSIKRCLCAACLPSLLHGDCQLCPSFGWQGDRNGGGMSWPEPRVCLMP